MTLGHWFCLTISAFAAAVACGAFELDTAGRIGAGLFSAVAGLGGLSSPGDNQ